MNLLLHQQLPHTRFAQAKAQSRDCCRQSYRFAAQAAVSSHRQLRQVTRFRNQFCGDLAGLCPQQAAPSAAAERLHSPTAEPHGHRRTLRGLFVLAIRRRPTGKPARRPPPKTGVGGRPNEVRQRLSKVLAAAGVASRRAAEGLIFAGDVKVNGRVVTEQTLVHPTEDKIEVKGQPIASQPQRKFYFAVNKPKGFACTSARSEGEGGSRVVLDLFDEWFGNWKRQHPRGTLPPRLYTVGRLDVPTTGLLFVTNDGQWAQQVMHPSSGLTKEYIATVYSAATRRQLQMVAEGCLVDGVQVQPVAVGVDNSDPSSRDRRVRISVAEGRNREVRTLLENAGMTVTYLKRVRIGGFRLPKDLGLGVTRLLKPNEVRRTLDRGAEEL